MVEKQSHPTAPPPSRLAPRDSSAHKGNFGRVLLIGGSRGMAGSISLSAIAALHTGSGLVAAAVPDSVLETVAGFHPALMTVGLPGESGVLSDRAWSELESRLPAQAAVGCGPGMTTGRGSTAIVEGLLRTYDLPMVLDADALNVIAEQNWLQEGRLIRSGSASPCVLTPHPGELQRLTGVSAKDVDGQVAAAVELSKRFGWTVVVKGGPTQVVDGDEVWVNTTGNPGMATAGCGDVLTGVITSLLGQGLSGAQAACLGVWIHGRAGDEAAARTSQIGMTAAHVLECLPIVADELGDV